MQVPDLFFTFRAFDKASCYLTRLENLSGNVSNNTIKAFSKFSCFFLLVSIAVVSKLRFSTIFKSELRRVMLRNEVDCKRQRETLLVLTTFLRILPNKFSNFQLGISNKWWTFYLNAIVNFLSIWLTKNASFVTLIIFTTTVVENHL